MFHRFELMVNTLFHIIKIRRSFECVAFCYKVCIRRVQPILYNQFCPESSISSLDLPTLPLTLTISLEFCRIVVFFSAGITRSHVSSSVNASSVSCPADFTFCSSHDDILHQSNNSKFYCQKNTLCSNAFWDSIGICSVVVCQWPLFASVCHCIQQNAEASGSIRCFECIDDATELAITIRCAIFGWRLLRVFTSWSGRRNFTSFSLSRLIVGRSWAFLYFVSPLLSSG